eukprot:CAMPEP_0174338018 /NCGR_PEP_ID=MMETSP0810-20121108/22813_1 /TAXON_ID=73025 ORGANISM="Eutreptiella gymnastica-like, Strain CCMP1594" /NCGR_SAMPLE_ID=MMETSP0810 /ASSEMBLY_ACC=CAM_ASM_000659 /LENGTH=109 /DNA_ID=CAMNT_0015457877 /DNA_START=296 /DNA_END=623 /DNA_ORIENTATION=+
MTQTSSTDDMPRAGTAQFRHVTRAQGAQIGPHRIGSLAEAQRKRKETGRAPCSTPGVQCCWGGGCSMNVGWATCGTAGVQGRPKRQGRPPAAARPHLVAALLGSPGAHP